MADCKEKLFTDFPPISTQEWMDKVTVDLKGADFNKKLVWKTNEGFNVKPMYRAEDIEGLKTTDSLPGEFPFVRGTKCNNEWLIRQDIETSCPQEANQQALSVLEKGVNSLGFHIKADQTTPDGIAALLNGIYPECVELNFNTCVKNAVKLAGVLTEYFKSTGANLEKINGSINFDPFARMLKRGREIENYVEIAAQLIKAVDALPYFRVLNVSAALLNNAGSYISQELGYGLAWGNEWMAKLTDAGFAPEEIAKRIKFNFGISSNYFMEIAKFRAARMLWAQIVAAYGTTCPCATKIKMHAQTSQFNMTIYDAHVNLLRSQTEAMSATLGGVDSLRITPFDITYKTPDEFSERIARNQQLLLKEESHFNKIVDPGAGSYYIENLTVSIAEQAWKLFLDIDDKGGFYSAIKEGSVQKEIKASSAARHTAIARRKEILLGTNQYPNINETASGKIEEQGSCGCGCNGHRCEATIETLSFERGASQFEALRMATEKAAKRPNVFMLTIGNLAMRLARSQFSGNFFGCAGYHIIDNLGFNTVQEGIDAAIKADADIIVLCSSDDEYATLAPEAKKALEGNKAILVVAGAPECMEELKAQGIDQFIHVRSNVLDTLKEFNTKLSIN